MESLSAYQSTFKPECILTGKKTNSARAKDCSCAEGVPKRSVGMKRKRNGGKPVFCFSKNAPTKHKTTELERMKYVILAVQRVKGQINLLLIA